jgi:hypothetical protein
VGDVSQPKTREGQVGPCGVADRFVVPSKPGNAGGGKGPDFKGVLNGIKRPESGHVAYYLQTRCGGPSRN